MIRRAHPFITCVLAACCVRAAAEPPPNRLTISADYNCTARALDKGRLLNGSVGGYESMKNLNWLPEAYDNLAAIGFKVIRLDHLVNDKFYRVVGRDEDGKLRFDFSRLDRVIKPMLDKGMTPLMCLCYCPDVLIPKGGHDGSAPKDMADWKQICKAYARHYKDLGHTGWCWEVWNEPDNEGFFKGSPQQYLEMYAKTAEGVKEADPTAKVGGAADASVLSATAKLPLLLDYIKEHPTVPLDFISYHKYGGSTFDEKPPYDLQWIFDEVAGIIKARGLASRDIFVTEWHLTPVMDAGPGKDSDTNVAAAGIAARMYNFLQYPALTKAFYFSPIEGYRPDRIFGGDLGLLTVNNHKKAAYNVFKMFAYLGDTLLETKIIGPTTKDRPTYAMATKDASLLRTTALLWNYSEQTVSVDLTINNLPYVHANRDIKVLQYQIDADHSNYHKDYQSGLRGCKIGPTEDLQPVDFRVIASASSFNREVTLLPFSVVEILLDPVGANEGSVPGVVAIPRGKLTVNLAAAKPVSFSSSLEKAGWGGNRVVDEITHSLPRAMGWSSEGHDRPEHDEWVCVDLGQSVEIDTVKLYPRDDQEAEGGAFPVDFKIQASDDIRTWTDLATRTNYHDGQSVLGVQTVTFKSAHCRYVRIHATKLGKVSSSRAEYRFQITELEVYGKRQ